MKSFLYTILFLFFLNLNAQSANEHKVAIFLVDLTNAQNTDELISQEKLSELIFDETVPASVASLYKEMSYSNQSLTGDFFGWYSFNPEHLEGYTYCFQAPLFREFIFEKHNSNEVDLSNYDDVFVITNRGDVIVNGCRASGQVSNHFIPEIGLNMGAGSVGISLEDYDDPNDNPFTQDVLESNNVWYGAAHEILHLNGVSHSRYLKNCNDILPINNSCFLDLNDNVQSDFSIMGGGNLSNHITPSDKESRGWLDDGRMITYSTLENKTINLHTSEQDSSFKKLKILKIELEHPIDIDYLYTSGSIATWTITHIYVEFRGFTGFNKDFDPNPNGVLVYAKVDFGTASNQSQSLLLDMNPNTGGSGSNGNVVDLSDAFLYKNETFTIPNNNNSTIKVEFICPGQYARISITNPTEEHYYLADNKLNFINEDLEINIKNKNEYSIKVKSDIKFIELKNNKNEIVLSSKIPDSKILDGKTESPLDSNYSIHAYYDRKIVRPPYYYCPQDVIEDPIKITRYGEDELNLKLKKYTTNVLISPNPNNGSFFLEKITENKISSIEILNFLGNKIQTINSDNILSKANSDQPIEVVIKTKGLFIIKIKDNQGDIFIKRVMIE